LGRSLPRIFEGDFNYCYAADCKYSCWKNDVRKVLILFVLFWALGYFLLSWVKSAIKLAFIAVHVGCFISHPRVWIAPVLAPIVCAITIIIFSGFMLHYQNKGYPVKMNVLEWSFMLLGALVILITFLWDFSKIIIKGRFLRSFLSLATDPHFKDIVTSYIPGTYHWTLFILGELSILCSLAIFVNRMKSVR
jgi:hypothetical protein